jgi:hypothetical protein
VTIRGRADNGVRSHAGHHCRGVSRLGQGEKSHALGSGSRSRACQQDGFRQQSTSQTSANDVSPHNRRLGWPWGDYYTFSPGVHRLWPEQDVRHHAPRGLFHSRRPGRRCFHRRRTDLYVLEYDREPHDPRNLYERSQTGSTSTPRRRWRRQDALPVILHFPGASRRVACSRSFCPGARTSQNGASLILPRRHASCNNYPVRRVGDVNDGIS